MTKRLETAWESYKAILPANASETQLRETRNGFYAGAQCLFHLLMSQLEEGADATEADLGLMDDLAEELRAFLEEVRARVNAGGSN